MSKNNECTREEQIFLAHVGENIRKTRLEKEITINELAQIVGRRFGTILLYETGESVMPLIMLKRIADALDTPVEKLLEINT